MAALRVAIVGAGLMGRWHAHYAARNGARVVAIVDRDPAVALALCKRHPTAEVFPDLDECLGRAHVDVVHVCTSTRSHPELALAALARGKHVLVEKPVAGSPAETRALVETSGRLGLRLCPVHQFPFQRGFREVRRGLGRLGELVSVAYEACTAGGDGLSGEARREVLLEILPHPFSLFRALGLAEWVMTGNMTVFLSDDDLRIDHGPGVGPSLDVKISLRGRPTRNELTLIGREGSALVDFYHGFRVVEPGTVSRAAKVARPFLFGTSLLATAGANLVRRALHAELAYPGLGDLLREFYGSIQLGAPPPIVAEEMVEIADVMERVRRAARQL